MGTVEKGQRVKIVGVTENDAFSNHAKFIVGRTGTVHEVKPHNYFRGSIDLDVPLFAGCTRLYLHEAIVEVIDENA